MKILLKIIKWLIIISIILIFLLILFMRTAGSPYRCDRISEESPLLAWVICGENNLE